MSTNTVEFRRALKQNTPSLFLREEHTRDCQVLPDRVALLQHLPHSGVAAEVGVAFGDYTSEILKHNRPLKLHLVDMWNSERYRAGLDGIRQRYAGLLKTGAIEIHQGMSTSVLETFKDGYFDWIYIDTDHSYDTTAAELRLAAAKLKPFGYIAGHDYCTGNVLAPWPYGVIEACNEFCVQDGWRYRYMTLEPHGHNSFALSRL
ncbi:class I SAM-dependent methyltransferase [Phreatobacter sp.]|uniref:class I SAM-dependent methyltransferase n=1 Tax=Phreatobacter sp. TaxID=1966341 RepID=UPI003F6F6613